MNFTGRISGSLFILIASFLFIVFTGCKKEPEEVQPEAGPNQLFYAVDNNNQLLQLNANAVGTPLSAITITGLQNGEKIIGMDFRPATGQLYALGSTSRIYVINTTTGAARMIGTGPFTPAIISTTGAGFNFNPTVDRIRVVSSTGQNLRINPENAAVVATDGNINGVANASIAAVAYSGNTAGSGNTVLYDIDVTTQKLYRQNPPNNGTLVEIGSLGTGAIQGAAGFDISPDGTVALASLSVNNETRLYRVDTASGKATFIGRFNASAGINAIAIPTNPVAYAVDETNTLLIFNPSANAAPVAKAITGIVAGENIVGIDFRPANGQLYALGSTSRLYTLNASSGAAALVGAGPLTTALSGTSFGFDFNPTVDRIRVVSDSKQNLRLHPETGAVAAVDLELNPGIAAVSAAAYTNNFAGATTTILFDIDHTTDKLYQQNPPNNGVLVEVGSLGINVESINGFDIGGTSGEAYGIFKVGNGQALYRINLTSGAATKIIDFSRAVRGFALGLGF